MISIRPALEKIGLTEGESQVYEALTELGLSRVGAITKRAKIGSSKVYEVLQRLENKGLVSWVEKSGVRHYDATPAERLIDFLEEKRDSLKAAQDEIKKIMPEIELKRKFVKEKTSIVVYSGLQGARIVLKETMEAGKKGAELMGFGTDEDPYKEYLPHDLAQHFKDQQRYKVGWKLLFNTTARNLDQPNPLGETRFLPQTFSLPLPVRTMIYGDKVAIVDFNEPITTIVIQKKEIVANYKKFFKFLWSIAKP